MIHVLVVVVSEIALLVDVSQIGRVKVLFARKISAFSVIKVKKTKHKTEEGLSKCVTLEGKETIKKCAHEKQDILLLGKIEGVDMHAREAMYHESCRRDYIRRTRSSIKNDILSNSQQL